MNNMLNDLRKIRNFDVSNYITKKVEAINIFFLTENLDSAVVGISGGIDSAIVLALLLEAQKQSNSPIKKILPLIIPIDNTGATLQFIAKTQGECLCDHYGIQSVVIDATTACNAIVGASMPCNDPWTIGQLVSIVRTPIMYYHAAILQHQGYKSIVVGTTNRDEGSYIGFFGKASDGMNDLQPIADIHKSEVFSVAKLLDVPSCIITATPKGDVFDGRCDEEMIGAPYWFLEMYLLAKQYNQLDKVNNLVDKAPEYGIFVKNIELLHQKNEHKYKVGSPARYIDVMPRLL